MFDDMSDAAMEALRKHKIRNLKLKAACFENEELIQDFVLEPDFSSDTQKQKLHAALEKGTELLRAVETGSRRRSGGRWP